MAKLLIPEELKEANGKVYWSKETLGFAPIDKVRKLFELNGLQGEVIDVGIIFYSGNRSCTTITYKCVVCGMENKQRLEDIKNGAFCFKCGKQRIVEKRKGSTFVSNGVKTLEDAQIVIGSDFEVHALGKIGKTKTIVAKCLKCLKKTEKQIGNWRVGHGCNYCKIKSRTNTTQEFIDLAKTLHAGFFDYSKVEYKSAHRKVTILCPKHGEFEQTPNKHLQLRGCPKCKESKGELEIRRFMLSKGLKIKSQHTFEECKYKAKLKFDFYIEELNLCIEINGLQHYKFVPYFHRKIKSFELQQLKDSIKRKFCESKKINLLEFDSRIDYNLEEVFKPYIERLENNELHTSPQS